MKIPAMRQCHGLKIAPPIAGISYCCCACHGAGKLSVTACAPVLPEVGSTSVVLPGAMSPRFSASSIMEKPIRSFTELHGSMLSSFTMIWHAHRYTAAARSSPKELMKSKGTQASLARPHQASSFRILTPCGHAQTCMHSTSALQPAVTLFRRTRGVRPMRSVMLPFAAMVRTPRQGHASYAGALLCTISSLPCIPPQRGHGEGRHAAAYLSAILGCLSSCAIICIPLPPALRKSRAAYQASQRDAQRKRTDTRAHSSRVY